MAITSSSEIIRYINNPDVSPTKLADAVIAGDSKIYSITGRQDWTVDDLVYGELVTIGSLWGAYTILIGYDSEEYLNKAKEIRDAFNDAVDSFRKIPLGDTKVDPNFVIASSDYTISKLNPDVPEFLSTY